MIRSGKIKVNNRSKYLGVLAERNFRRFYIGYASSLLGTAMSSVAIAFAVLDSGGSPTVLGVVFTANIVPMIVFMLGGGVLADRVGRRPVMLAADLARCAAQSALACGVFLGYGRIWLFAVAAFTVGTGTAFFQPALKGLTVALAPRERLGDANALFGMAQPGAQVAGPALAGVLIAVASPAAVIAVDAASYAVSAIALTLLRFPSDSGRAPRNSLLRDLAEGWAEFSARSWLWLQTVQFALFNLLTWGPYLVLGPVLARQYLGGARAWGTVLACYGLGAIAGGALALGRRPRRPMLVSTLATFGYPLPVAALALRLPLACVAAGALLAGVGSALGGAIASTVTQRRVPAAALSRVGSFNLVGAYAIGPAAFVAAGPVASVVGARAVLGFGAAWAAFGTVAVLAAPAVRNLGWEDDLGSADGRLDGGRSGLGGVWLGRFGRRLGRQCEQPAERDRREEHDYDAETGEEAELLRDPHRRGGARRRAAECDAVVPDRAEHGAEREPGARGGGQQRAEHREMPGGRQHDQQAAEEHGRAWQDLQP
jgi:transmembrane secretion effector